MRNEEFHTEDLAGRLSETFQTTMKRCGKELPAQVGGRLACHLAVERAVAELAADRARAEALLNKGGLALDRLVLKAVREAMPLHRVIDRWEGMYFAQLLLGVHRESVALRATDVQRDAATGRLDGALQDFREAAIEKIAAGTITDATIRRDVRSGGVGPSTLKTLRLSTRLVAHNLVLDELGRRRSGDESLDEAFETADSDAEDGGTYAAATISAACDTRDPLTVLEEQESLRAFVARYSDGKPPAELADELLAAYGRIVAQIAETRNARVRVGLELMLEVLPPETEGGAPRLRQAPEVMDVLGERGFLRSEDDNLPNTWWSRLMRDEPALREHLKRKTERARPAVRMAVLQARYRAA